MPFELNPLNPELERQLGNADPISDLKNALVKTHETIRVLHGIDVSLDRELNHTGSDTWVQFTQNRVSQIDLEIRGRFSGRIKAKAAVQRKRKWEELYKLHDEMRYNDPAVSDTKICNKYNRSHGSGDQAEPKILQNYRQRGGGTRRDA